MTISKELSIRNLPNERQLKALVFTRQRRDLNQAFRNRQQSSVSSLLCWEKTRQQHKGKLGHSCAYN